ncbi:MAG: AraC family transcriptional regulator, partial [Sphaerochaeta sp.]
RIFEKLSLSDVASYVERDPSYFVRLFKSWMNITPMQYYANLQLEAARALLANTNLSVKEVAARLHYCSEFHFSKQFKRSTQLSPTEYRLRYRQKLGPFN